MWIGLLLFSWKIPQTLRFSFKHIYFWLILIPFLSISSAHSIFLGQWFLCFLKFLSYLFIFGCAGSLLLCVGFSLVVVSRDCSPLRYTGFSFDAVSRCRAWDRGAWASVVLAHSLNSCSCQAPATGSAVVAPRLTCSVARRIFLG